MTTRQLIPPGFVAAAIVLGALLARLPAAAEEPAACDDPGKSPGGDAWRVEYTLNAKLRIEDTMMGAGDGEYDLGPGSVVLRYENQGGKPGGNVQMLSYKMRDVFTVTAKVLFWGTSVKTDTNTRATPDGCGIVAKGALSGDTLTWNTKVAGYRADGSLTCDGNMCGKFGAPPSGKSDYHLPPRGVQFEPFKFGKDKKTFTMASSFVSHADSPKHTTYVALAGRETTRSCVVVKPCK